MKKKIQEKTNECGVANVMLPTADQTISYDLYDHAALNINKHTMSRSLAMATFRTLIT
jgi:hypothetical protein